MRKDPFCRTPVWSKRETFLFNFCSSVREIWAIGTQNTNPYLLFSSKMKYIFVNFTLLSPRSIGGTKKKKSWVSNALNPTYRWAWVTPWVLHRNCLIIFFSVGNILTLLLRSRCDDLRRNFPGLPPNETLIVDYSCALQKDILVCEEKNNFQGKLMQLLCTSMDRFLRHTSSTLSAGPWPIVRDHKLPLFLRKHLPLGDCCHNPVEGGGFSIKK